MRRVVALLAAVLLLAGLAGCGGNGAEPGAPQGASLVLDFTPNAAHSGIYAAQAEGFYEHGGIDLTVHQPGESTDAPKLLAAGKVDFAVMDITDFGIADEHLVSPSNVLLAVMPIVQRPLAAVIARGDRGIESPKDLEGKTVGVTGLPSDVAVLDSEVEAAGGDPSKVHTVTIGFNAVSALAAGKVDAVTAFWNAEGVALKRKGVPVKVFKVDRYGAPPYPELVLAVSIHTWETRKPLVEKVLLATKHGYEFTATHPSQALDDLLAADPALDRGEQQAQLQALLPDLKPAPFDEAVLKRWATWAGENGLLHTYGAATVPTTFTNEDLSLLGF
jgi:NitT/TauT family transport system substrate-binding protein/putative hydroxymethylpyrimidine transport system substrate-binding protein